MTLTKAHLTQALVERVGFNTRESSDLVDAFFEELSMALTDGEGVKLANFGHFQTRDKVARPGRNPKTGVTVEVTARRVVTFHPSFSLKAAVDQIERKAPAPDAP